MIKISLILPEYVDSVWGGIEGYMDKAAEYSYGRYKTEDIKAVILDGSRQLWQRLSNSGDNDNGCWCYYLRQRFNHMLQQCTSSEG